MNKQQFEEILEKFKKAPVEFEVLCLVLKGLPNGEIAKSRKSAKGTISKTVSNIYEKFGIKSEFPGDQPQRDKLKDLFLQHKPEWVSNDFSVSTDENIKQLENITNKGLIPLVPSDEELVPELEEELISFAISILEEIGFDEIFKMKRALDFVGYKPKINIIADKRYQLFLEYSSNLGLSVSINKNILEPHLLNLKYWVDLGDSNWNTEIAGIFLVIPGKENLFLHSLKPKYWNILEIEGKTIGDVYLNDQENPEYYDNTTQETTKKCLEGFNKSDLSDSESYLNINENKEFNFNYTWQMVINSRAVLKDFLIYFGKILMNIQSGDTSDIDDIPF
ncbi:hypothetical protein H6G06_02840 [Anabaena sphaerica FACHB-251]|uniref:HTH luxR-type domain-containing protein n=1 Tax=Anabaena sphaerica FACHB-251 TaxID=2692883 RepID=A0A926ZZA4_9NOST|nr:LuxR C-terminal-related transcriptional regulator [Anabaena sphaerica]MBD2292444.1 hypothetical protein [Anabaena sphaerica FACHB-251]